MKKAKRRAEDFGNRVTLNERILAAAVAVSAMFVAWDLVLADSATIVQYRRGGWIRRLLDPDWRPEVVVLHGWPLFWAYLVLTLVALMALTFLLDHYDRRFNARFYVRLRCVMLWITGGVAVIGTAVSMLQISAR